MSKATTITSNTPGGGGLDSWDPPETNIFYEGEKVTLSIGTTNLFANGYTQVLFYLAVDDELQVLDPNPDGVSGTACHPDSEGNLVQPVVAAQSTYSIDTVIMGKAGEAASWNVAITGPQQTTLSFDSNISYQTKKSDIDGLWSNQVVPPGNITSPDGQNSLHVQNLQVKDKITGAAEQKKFSAFIHNKNKHRDLSKLYFFDKNKAKISATPDEKVIWIDSDENGVLDFYITAHTGPADAYIETLIMRVGTTQVDLPTIAIFDFATVPADAQLDAPQLDGGDSTYQVDVSQPVGVIVPPPEQVGSLDVGDTLFLVVNERLLPETGTPYNAGVINSGDPFFNISPNTLNFSWTGAENSMAYLVIREANPPVKSSEYKFKAKGVGEGIPINPPFPAGGVYTNPPTVDGFDPGATLGSDDVKNGLTVRITWDGFNWPTQVSENDVFTVYAFISGFDRKKIWQGPIVSLDTSAVTVQDLANGYIDTKLDGKYFRWWGRGPKGEKSFVEFQYYVKSAQSFSPPSDSPYILTTIPPGGV